MDFNPFDAVMNDVVTLVKADGTRSEVIRAQVGRNNILILANALLVNAGDAIEREYPGGIDRYTVLDPGYEGEFHGIPARYSMEVRKETALPRSQPQLATSHNYYLSGQHSRVNNHSVDASVNTMTWSASPVFAQIRDALANVEDEKERNELLACVEQMEASHGSPGFLGRYQAFIQAVANHMTIVAPFLPALAQLLQ